MTDGPVSLIECRDYDPKQIDAALSQLLAPLGGMKAFVRPGERILIKPNLLMGMPPERAVSTHPEIIRAVAAEVLRAGGRPVIADSPGGITRPGQLDHVYRISGMAEAARRASLEGEGEVVLDRGGKNGEHFFPEGRIIRTAPVIRAFLDADRVINVCKLKTHVMMHLTGAVKNLFGVVAGRAKVDFHLRFRNYDIFAGALLDISQMVHPVLNIMDAVVGMEGMGPSNGKPRQTGFLLASPDACALDLAAAYLVGMRPEEVPTLRVAHDRGLAPMDPSRLRIVGGSLKDHVVKDYKKPARIFQVEGYDRYLPGFMKGLLRFVQPRPAVYRQNCRKCGDCVRSCPPQAMDMGKQGPDIRYDACIRCYCCQELCKYDAIRIHQPVLARRILRR
ncbi:MAG TPA: iron-sulfur protein [Clostridiales bacterium]|nr:iron-sulfur protein [Clostridiales bacterium]